MAATKITCPECDTVLRPNKPVPAGKKVKCPRCGALFTAGSEPEDVAPRAPARKKPGGNKPAKAAPARPAPKDEDEEVGGTYAFVKEEEEEKPDIDYAPDMSIKDLRGPAQAVIVKPSNYLIMAGIAGVIGWLGLLIVVLIPILFPLKDEDTERPAMSIGPGLSTMMPEQTGNIPMGLGGGGGGSQEGSKETKEAEDKEKESGEFFRIGTVDLASLVVLAWWMILAIVVLPLLLGAVYSGILTAGAVKMQNLESRGWGIAGCILAMIPINVGGLQVLVGLVIKILLAILFDEPDIIVFVVMGLIYLLSLAAGIWNLLVLMKPEVIAGFEYVAE
jgi:predicted Zn finger-like uncharacterized protein